MKFGFIGPTYQSLSPNVDAERCLNFYPEVTDGGQAKAKVVLYGTPGLRVFGTSGTGPVRALFFLNGRCFLVSGVGFYEIKADGTSALWGTVANDGGLASISSNGTGGNQVFIVTGGLGYIFNTATSVFAQIVDADFPAGAVMGGYTDGYFIVLRPDSMTWQISALFDGTSWDALDVAQKTKTPDIIKGIYVDHGEVWLFGEQNTEVWYNVGDPDFPFTPIQGVLIPQGIAGRYAWTKLGNGVGWLGSDINGNAVFYRSNAYTPVRASNNAVEQAWRQYQTVADAIMWSYQSDGHTFCVISFPSANKSWAFDLSTEMWHERAFRNPINNGLEAHLGQCHAFAHSVHLVGSRRDGTVYQMSNGFFSDADDKILRQRRSPHVSDEQVRLFFDYFQLDFQAGNAASGDCNPQIMLRWSDDGGHTWSPEWWTGAGAVGRYNWRAIWRRLGHSRDRIWEVTVTENVFWAFIDAYMGAKKGRL